VELNKIYNMDCLAGMKEIPDKSIDMILCDLPYGTIDSKWDVIIPFDELWEQYERIITDRGAIVLTANGSFTHKLVASNLDLYRYKWIWLKNKAGNFINAKNRPMTSFEEVLVFSKGVTANGSNNRMNYFPQGLRSVNQVSKSSLKNSNHVGKRPSHKEHTIQEYTNYPKDVLRFSLDKDTFHPTQKPVSLFEYLLKTYSEEGNTVLDNCMGSGTTAIAAIRTNRNFIGFEMEKEYYEKSIQRIETEKKRPVSLWG